MQVLHNCRVKCTHSATKYQGLLPRGYYNREKRLRDPGLGLGVWDFGLRLHGGSSLN